MFRFYLICQAKLYLKGDQDFCSIASHNKYAFIGTIDVPPNDAGSVTVPITPKIVGKVNVEVVVIGTNPRIDGDSVMDAVRRRLLIVVSPLVCRCQATCKRTHQLQTLLAQQCWELLRPCWQCCASGCNNSQHCWEGYHPFVNQVLYVCVAPTMLEDLRRSCANGSTIVTFRFRDHGTNERNVGICWLKSLAGSNLCATTRNNTQQHAKTRNNTQ